jgi:hypothetical protein
MLNAILEILGLPCRGNYFQIVNAAANRYAELVCVNDARK